MPLWNVGVENLSAWPPSLHWTTLPTDLSLSLSLLHTHITFLDLCMSSLRRGHANLLCIVPILSDVPEGTPTHILFLFIFLFHSHSHSHSHPHYHSHFHNYINDNEWRTKGWGCQRTSSPRLRWYTIKQMRWCGCALSGEVDFADDKL